MSARAGAAARRIASARRADSIRTLKPRWRARFRAVFSRSASVARAPGSHAVGGSTMDLSDFVRIAAFLALASAARAGDTAMFADGTFGAGWTSTKIVDTTSGASATFTSTTIPTGGGPGPYRETSHTFNAGTIVVAHANPLYVYDPSSVPICSIDLSWYLVHFTGSSVGGAVSYRLGLLQAGSWYSGPSIDVYDALWAGYAQTDLRASQFTLLTGTGPATPDFSCTGGLIQFGFLTANSSGSAGFVTKTSGCDEWNVTLHLEQHTFVDGTFNPSDWSITLAYNAPNVLYSITNATPATGGNPGAHRETNQTGGWGGTGGEVVVSHLNVLAVHDPSIEPIYAVDWSWDIATLNGPGAGNQAAYHLALYQAGTHYRSENADFNPSASWASYSEFDVPSTGFTRIVGPGPIHPDFTSSGGLIQFGYASRIVVVPLVNNAWEHEVDNWSVRVKLAPPCAPAVGSAHCFGDEPLNPCPCFPSVPAGAAGRGCPNSVEPRGALIEAHGVASISADTLVLMASGMPNSSCLYYQGTATTGTAFGDGRRCTSGAVIRLGTKVNMCGASQVPSALDPTISIKGAVTTPGLRHYQAWYRNAASFCTFSTFNLTNGLTVAWGS
jgi:hypothetical protein